jgi:hypothetical protein
MNRLKDAIEARKAEGQSGELCYSTHWAATPTLRVETSVDEVWLFPWHHFVHSRHLEEGELERLVLTFAANDIFLCGTNLAALMEHITEQRLKQLRPAPKKYQAAADAEPFLVEILVRPVSE